MIDSVLQAHVQSQVLYDVLALKRAAWPRPEVWPGSAALRADRAALPPRRAGLASAGAIRSDHIVVLTQLMACSRSKCKSLHV